MQQPLDLTGQSILVTGASSGIGRGCCVYLSRLGARIVAAGRDAARLEETLGALEGSGHEAWTVDLTGADLRAGLRGVVAGSGPLNGMVHSAGLHQAIPLRAITDAKLKEIFAVNVHSAILLAQAFCEKGIATRPASIVFMSSVTALTGSPALTGYSATKGAIVSAARCLAVELARLSIRVNCVAPGVVETPMLDQLRSTLTDEQFQAIEASHPLGVGTVDDVAASVAFLLSPMSKWITGTTLIVDGGYTAQ